MLCTGQSMPEMMTPHLHNISAGHSTPETTPEMISDTQRPQVSRRGANTWWRNGREEDQKAVDTKKRGRTGDSRRLGTISSKWPMLQSGTMLRSSSVQSLGTMSGSLALALALHQQESDTHQRPDRYTWSGLSPGDVDVRMLGRASYTLHLTIVGELAPETWVQVKKTHT